MATLKNNAARGMTMIEIVIYAFITITIAFVITNTLVSIGGSYRALQSSSTVDSTAETALERMTRETRDALSIDLAQSTLNTSPGTLTLNTTDDSGNPATVQFLLSGQTLHVKENGVDTGPLSASAARITNLIFRRLTTAQSQAVKIEMTVEAGTSTTYFSKYFYSTVVLRGSYPTQ